MAKRTQITSIAIYFKKLTTFIHKIKVVVIVKAILVIEFVNYTMANIIQIKTLITNTYYII